MIHRKLASRLKSLVQTPPAPMQEPGATRNYHDRVAAEHLTFSGCQSQNELPGIYSYWSNRYLRPQLESLGYSTPELMFGDHFVRAYRSAGRGPRAFVSLGSGACDTEIRIARFMQEQGCDDFTLECFELNDALVQEGRRSAAMAGMGECVLPIGGDFNTWIPSKHYDGVLANNSLHHVMNLEGLLAGVQQCLLPTGTFVTSDMIGRNGHMRWPEALEIVHEFWRELPTAKTFNHLLQRHEPLYENWDCSTEGFEGIRAQEILPLLIAYFEFDAFLPFANVIDPFVERTFGPNFEPTNADDRAFIDRVHARDAEAIARGSIKPTHILAAMCVGRAGTQKYVDGLTPAFSVRSPHRPPIATYVPPAPDPEPGVATGPSPRHDYSDMWWNPLEPGWGLAIHQHPSQGLIGAWLTYRPDRSPAWYSIQPGRWTNDAVFEGILYEAQGPGFAATPAAPGLAASVRQVGKAQITFLDASNGVIACQIGDLKWSSPICRMEF